MVEGLPIRNRDSMTPRSVVWDSSDTFSVAMPLRLAFQAQPRPIGDLAATLDHTQWRRARTRTSYSSAGPLLKCHTRRSPSRVSDGSTAVISGIFAEISFA